MYFDYFLMSGLTLIIIVLLLFLLSMVWPPDSPWSPWWSTSKRIALIMCTLAKITKKDVIYDLGSGTGTALITAAKTCGAKGTGIEIDPLRFVYSRFAIRVNRVSGKIKIVRKNFFDVDVSKATVIFMYLVPKTLARLRPKLLQQCRPGTRVATFVYKMDLPLIAEDKQNEVYIYEIPKKK